MADKEVKAFAEASQDYSVTIQELDEEKSQLSEGIHALENQIIELKSQLDDKDQVIQTQKDQIKDDEAKFNLVLQEKNQLNSDNLLLNQRMETLVTEHKVAMESEKAAAVTQHKTGSGNI